VDWTLKPKGGWQVLDMKGGRDFGKNNAGMVSASENNDRG
jgi:hypothetical protein